MSFWYVYVLRSLKDKQFYSGSTNNLKRRLQQHQRGENVSTAKRLPVEMIYFEGHRSKDDALRREKYFKTAKGKTTLRLMLRDSLQQQQPNWQNA
ncbi:MAG: GIY-YIG nuclease family protein [bacterium]|nr:GIY-YIG nuclease family protein [bacterium]